MSTAVETEAPPFASATGWARPAIGWRLDASLLQKLGALSVAALPALLTLYLSFNSGGFFASATGVAVVVLAGTVALRMALVRDAFGGFSRPLLIAIGALAVYSLWSLLSMSWSHSPSRGLLDFDLANVYLFSLVLFGSFARSQRRVRWTLILTWLSMLAICLAGLATRLRPDLFPISDNGETRLWFPMTYSDALGLFAVCGMLFAAHLACSSREPAALRILGSAAIPVFAVTVLLTYSRAALLLAPLALIAYVLLAQPRGIVAALLAAGPPTAYALIAAYQASLVSNGATSAAAVQQGRALTTTIVLACAAAAVTRTVLLKLDTYLGRVRVRTWRRWYRAIAGGCCLGGVVIVCLVVLGGRVSHQWGSFTRQSTAFVTKDARDRASHINVSLAERLPNWRIALRVFDEHPLRGDGAGTFANDWYRLRPNQEVSLQTHSLYLEAMSELGVVGLAVLLVAVVTVVSGGFVRARRRSSRSLWIVIGLAGLVWAIDAGFDWDWEMPAVTLPIFVLGACALANRGSGPRLHPRTELLLRVGISLIALGAVFTASRIAVSDAQTGRSVRAFNSGNCPAAVADARASVAAMSSLSQPYAILGYCAIRAGAPRAAVADMTSAVRRDPENWLYRYGLAIADAAAHRDPHPALRQAHLLNPLEPMIQNLAMKLRGNNPSHWQEVAEVPQMSLQQ